MRQLWGYALILIGSLFDLFGCIGLVRLPDLYNRLQASTKCVTMGTCLILLGTLVLIGFTPAAGKIILCLIFVLITAPTAAHALARASHFSGISLWEGSVCDLLKEDREQ
ncbi:MAG: monovalent cation/H(+) antiporter subunit G [Candidatus Omnitrophica bacterium]|nr:monovalent cation/H(+) antiporter subunit G [Candidatus Omnitrophota bacterium]